MRNSPFHTSLLGISIAPSGHNSDVYLTSIARDLIIPSFSRFFFKILFYEQYAPYSNGYSQNSVSGYKLGITHLEGSYRRTTVCTYVRQCWADFIFISVLLHVCRYPEA